MDGRIGEIITKLDNIKRMIWYLLSTKRHVPYLDNQIEWIEEDGGVKTVEDLLQRVNNYYDLLISDLSEEEVNKCYEICMEEWIDPDYSRVFYNELDSYVDAFVEELREFVEENLVKSKYAVCVYDLSDEYFSFNSKKEADEFIELLSGPWTLFKETETELIEIASE